MFGTPLIRFCLFFRFPDNGILTWANQDVVDGKKYAQIYDGGDSAEYRNNADYLWRFVPVVKDVTLP